MSTGLSMLTPNLATPAQPNFPSILLSCCLQMPFGWRSGICPERALPCFNLQGSKQRASFQGASGDLRAAT